MRLHENNNEEDELQRLRAPEWERTEADVLSRASNLHHSEQNLGQTDRQTRTVNLTYDEDYYEEEDYDYNEDYTENSGSDGSKVPFQNETADAPG